MGAFFLLAISVLAVVVLAPAASVTGLSAQTGTVYVAHPGDSFGPLKIGDSVPSGWTVSCVAQELTTPPRLLFTTFFFPQHGFSVDIDLHNTSPDPAVSTGRIWSISADTHTHVFPDAFKGGCTTPEGHVVKKDIDYSLPRGTVYVTNNGIRLGATVEAVIAAHGVPLRSTNQPGGQRVAHLSYCGLSFFFDARSRLSSIEVDSKTHCHP
jgi:hypothetical protein